MTVSYTISPAIPARLMEQTVPGKLLLKFLKKEAVDGVTMARLYHMGPDFDKLQNYYYLSLQKDHQYDGVMDISHTLANEMLAFAETLSEDHPLYDLKAVAEASLSKPGGLRDIDDWQFEEKLEDLLQALCQEAPDKLSVITVEGSRTGDKLQIGEHGGFASVVTADGYERMTTQMFIAEAKDRLKAKKSVEAEASKPGL